MTDYTQYIPDGFASDPPPDSLSKDFKLYYPSPSTKDDAAMRAYGNQTDDRYLRFVGWQALRDGLSDEQILKKLEAERGKQVAYKTVQSWIRSEFRRILSGLP